jgi:cytochrome c oxidase subunit III
MENKSRYIDINTDIIRDEPQPTLSMNPMKFALWLFIASIVMIFASLTSAYIVRRSEGNWFVFDLPPALNISSAIVVLSSVTMIWAVVKGRSGDFASQKLAVAITTLLGLAFCVGQWIGFGEMIENGIYLVGNPSGSFVYILIGLHVLHLVAGIVFLLIILSQSFTGAPSPRKLTTLEIGSTFWHFLGGLWIYLYFFLLVNR